MANFNDELNLFKPISLCNVQPTSYTAAQNVSFGGYSLSAFTCLRSWNVASATLSETNRVLATLIADLMNPNKPS